MLSNFWRLLDNDFIKTTSKFLDGGFGVVENRVARFATLKNEDIYLVRKKMKFIRFSKFWIFLMIFS